jgi:hypothetical protein
MARRIIAGKLFNESWEQLDAENRQATDEGGGGN